MCTVCNAAPVPVASIHTLVQVKQRLGAFVGMQPVPDSCIQVEETVMAHRELLEAFESCCALITAEQLLELDHDDLIGQPLQAVEGIYTHFGLACAYAADPMRLPLQAERRLQSLME